MPQPYLVYCECPCLRGDTPQRRAHAADMLMCVPPFIPLLATVAAQWLHRVWLHSVPCALCQTMSCVRLQAASGTTKFQGKKVQHRSSVLCAGSAPFCA